jgi:hypothetical protein
MRLRLDLGFHVHTVANIRLLDWSCPELREPNGPEARMVAEAFLTHARRVMVTTEKDTQSFARWVGRVFVDGVELGQKLADNGLATRTVL